MLTRKLFLASSVALAAALAGGAASAADQITYQLAWLPGGDKAPAYVAIHEGLFAKAGLDVKVVSSRGSSEVLTKVATGVYDIGEAGLDVLMVAKAEGTVPVVAVMPLYTKKPDTLIVTTSSGINSLKDLVGRSVGTSTSTSSNLVWPFILKMNGVDPDSVKLLKVEVSALNAMLATGKVDAIINFTTVAPSAVPMLSAAGKTMKLLPWSEYGFEGYSTSIIASNKFLAERPDVARRFLRVMRESIRLMQDQPDKAVEAVMAILPQLDRKAVRGQVDAAVPMMINEVSAKDGLGVFSPARVKMTWEWAAKAGNYPVGKLDPLTAVNGQFINRE